MKEDHGKDLNYENLQLFVKCVCKIAHATQAYVQLKSRVKIIRMLFFASNAACPRTLK